MSSQENSERREEGVTHGGLTCHLCPVHHASLCKGTSCGAFGGRTACSSLLSGSSCCMSRTVVCQRQHCSAFVWSCGGDSADDGTATFWESFVLDKALRSHPSLRFYTTDRVSPLRVRVFPPPYFHSLAGTAERKRRKKKRNLQIVALSPCSWARNCSTLKEISSVPLSKRKKAGQLLFLFLCVAILVSLCGFCHEWILKCGEARIGFTSQDVFFLNFFFFFPRLL